MVSTEILHIITIFKQACLRSLSRYLMGNYKATQYVVERGKQSKLTERAETQNHCNSAKFHLERLFHQTSQRNPLGFQNSTDRLLIKHALALISLFGLLTTPCATCYVLSDINRIRGCERRIPLCRKPQLCFLLGPCLLVAWQRKSRWSFCTTAVNDSWPTH